MKNGCFNFTVFAALFLVFSMPGPALAAAAAQGDACTVTDKIYTTDQPGAPSLYCDGANLQYFFTQKDNALLSCGATTEGALRYSSSNIEMCDGTDWSQLVASTCDSSPAFPVFTNLTAQTISTLVTSNIVQITNMDAGCNVTVGVSGTGGSPQYRTCSDSGCSSEIQTWTGTDNSLDMQGNYIQLRATTSASSETAFTITAAIGPVSSDWVVTTGLTDCAPIGTVCADGSVYAGLYAGSTPMFATRCDAGQTWGGASCSGAASHYTWNAGNTNALAYVSAGTSLSDGQSNTTTLIATDSDSVTAGTQNHNAAQFCADLTLHSQSDWYLPSKDELAALYANRTAIGTFDLGASTSYYWSSSENNASTAWDHRFSTGATNTTPKYITSSRKVRCARR